MLSFKLNQAQPAEGRSRRTGGRSVPTTSIRRSIQNAGGAFTNRMTVETLRVRADIACVIYIWTWAVTTTRKWYWLFLGQSDFKVMSLNRRFNQRIKGSATSVVASSFELKQRVAASPRHPDLIACYTHFRREFVLIYEVFYIRILKVQYIFFA